MVRSSGAHNLLADLKKKLHREHREAGSSSALTVFNVEDAPVAASGKADLPAGAAVEAAPISVAAPPSSDDVPPAADRNPRLKKKARKISSAEEEARMKILEVGPSEVEVATPQAQPTGQEARSTSPPAQRQESEVGRRPPVAFELRKIEMEVARRRKDLLAEPVVDMIDRSSLNFYKCMKVHSMLVSHLAACAQQRAAISDPAIQELSAQRDNMVSAEREKAMRSVVALTEQRDAAVAEKASLELSVKERLAEVERRSRAAEESLRSEIVRQNSRIKSLEADLKFSNNTRDEISRSLAKANQKIDSLTTYEQAVSEFKGLDEYRSDMDQEGHLILLDLHASFSAAVKKMYPSTNMLEFIDLVTEESEALDKRREEEAREELGERSSESPADSRVVQDKGGPYGTSVELEVQADQQQQQQQEEQQPTNPAQQQQ